MVQMFLITANVGSVFDNMEQGLPVWLKEFESAVRSKNPEFVAIHFQETGGKGYDDSSETIKEFFRKLVDMMEHFNFRVAEAFVDSTSDVEDQFTALSSIYFVHESLRLPVHIWDFQDAKFHEVTRILTPGSQTLHPNIYMGSRLNQTHRKQKEKFPQDFYPNCKWSRKGFLRTRWRFGGTTVDLVNIHLFHDSCNLMAASVFPSPFAQHREKSLKYTLDRIQSDDLEKSPLFIFGDFNFRLNAHGIMNILKKDFGDPVPKLGEENELVLAAKKFHCPEQELRFKDSYDWLKQYDFEPKQLFPDLLQEYDLNFHPTYPFSEDINEPERYMRTRIPAWCDRVLFTPSTKDIFAKDFRIDYDLIGSKVSMGDHKPVGLSLKIQTNNYASTNCTSDPGINSTCDPPTSIKGKLVSMMLISELSKSSTSLTTSPATLVNGALPRCTEMAVVTASSSADAIETENDNDSSVAVVSSFHSYCHPSSVLNGCSNHHNSGHNNSGAGLNKSLLNFSSADLINIFPPSRLEDGAGSDNTNNLNGNETIDSGFSIPSSNEKSNCFLFYALLRCRGKVRFSQDNKSNYGGGNNNSGHNNFRALSSLKALSKCKRGGCGSCSRSGSLLEPIAGAGCEFACSSLPESQVSSQRPSIADTEHIDSSEDANQKVMPSNIFCNNFAVPSKSLQNTLSNAVVKRCKDCHRRVCSQCCCYNGILTEESSITPDPRLSNSSIDCHCQNRLMHNLKTMISNNCSATTDTNINNCRNIQSTGAVLPLGSSNLSLLAINSNTDLDKQSQFVSGCSNENKGKIPVCWATNSYNNSNDVSVNDKNRHNLNCMSGNHHHYYPSVEKKSKSKKDEHSGLPFNIKNTSTSQAAAIKCKCRAAKDSTTGDCITCSKCVII